MSGFWLIGGEYSDHWFIIIIKYRNNLQQFESLLHHRHNWSKKTKTDKVWICGSVGKLKGVWNQAKEKINELIIHNNNYNNHLYYLEYGAYIGPHTC